MTRKRTPPQPVLLLPRAVRNAESATRQTFNDLVTVAREIDDLEQEQVLLVNRARQAGLSWDSIGRAVGTSGTAARKRFMDACDDDAEAGP